MFMKLLVDLIGYMQISKPKQFNPIIHSPHPTAFTRIIVLYSYTSVQVTFYGAIMIPANTAFALLRRPIMRGFFCMLEVPGI